MQTIETILQRELTKLVDERIADLQKAMVNPSLELAEYRLQVGKILAFQELPDMISQANERAQQRNR